MEGERHNRTSPGALERTAPLSARIWVVSIAAALAGTAVLRLYLYRFEQEVSGGPSTRVVVFTRDLDEGAVLTREALGTRALPQAYLESRHVRASDLDQVLGVRLAVAAQAGETLLWTDLASLRARPEPVSSLVPEGMRAVVLARASNGLDGIVGPGDRVDVLLAEPRAPGTQVDAVLVAENLLVLAVGSPQGARGSNAPARTGGPVTVSVTPEQALQLAAAERAGALRLVLRNPDDLALGTERR
jgi:pilus assembly protein CpaB